MCGIYGFVSEDQGALGEAHLEAAVSALSHRGPDGRGTWLSKLGDRRARCGFAHTRLSILDLSDAGHQPMLTEDGRYAITFNGEIYNFSSIRSELEKLGTTFRSNSDTEVLLKAFAAWGPACLHKLRGMFAFGIWDHETQRLFLARDRLGIKPLYYCLRDRAFFFSSEVRALLTAGAVPRKLNRDALFGYLAVGSIQEPDTIVRGVEMLPPGHFLVHSEGRIESSRYWALTDHVGGTPLSFEEGREMLSPILAEAVKLRLVSDVPVGIFLSGGIDSSAVLAHASRASTKPLNTFTITFDEAAYSEAEYARIVATEFGANHHDLRLRAAKLRDDLPLAALSLDQPTADGINTFFVSRAVKQAGISVALSGLGGDEVFAGYSQFRRFRSLLAGGRLASNLLAPIASKGPEWTLGLGHRPHRVASLLAAAGDPQRIYSVLRSMFTLEEARRLLRTSGRAERFQGSLELKAADAENTYSVLELSNYLRNTLLRDTDVMSMAHALEVRVPLIDHVLVEGALRVSGPAKLPREKRGSNKPLLTALTPALPTKAVNRAKMGFTLPFETWFKGPLKSFVEHHLTQGSLFQANVFSREAVDALWRGFLSGNVAYSRVWCLAALGHWVDSNRMDID